MKQMNRKTKLIAGVVAAVVVIAAVIATLYFTLWMPPSKQDFADNKAKAEKIADYSGSKLLGAYTTKINEQRREGKLQDDLINSAKAEKQKVDDAINSRVNLAQEIKDSRVVRDEAVKKSFDTYYAKEQKYDAYILGYANAYPVYMSSFGTCIKPFQINDPSNTDVTVYAKLHRDAAKACLEDLDTLSKSPVTPLANYAKEFARIINERQKVFDQLEKKTLDEKTAGNRIKELGNDYTKNNPLEGLSKFARDASFKGELDALIKALDDKAKAAK